jgi:hypothetical protein
MTTLINRAEQKEKAKAKTPAIPIEGIGAQKPRMPALRRSNQGQ